jgi:hypothetical protein
VVEEDLDVLLDGGAVGVPPYVGSLLEQADVAVAVGPKGARVGAEIGLLQRRRDTN